MAIDRNDKSGSTAPSAKRTVDIVEKCRFLRHVNAAYTALIDWLITSTVTSIYQKWAELTRLQKAKATRLSLTVGLKRVTSIYFQNG